MLSPEVCTLTGATYRQLDYWTTAGWVSPSEAEGIGSGHNRVWSFDDCVQIAVMAQLCAAGVAASVAGREFGNTNESRYRMYRFENVGIAVDVQRIRESLKAKLESQEAA